MKKCIKCGLEKPQDSFHRNGRASDGLYSWCRECSSERNKTYQRSRKYGITEPQFTALIEKQEGRCAICSVDICNDACVDHCHETGIVRGLLCRYCNMGLGHLGDNVAGLKRALNYLEKNT